MAKGKLKVLASEPAPGSTFSLLENFSWLFLEKKEFGVPEISQALLRSAEIFSLQTYIPTQPYLT